MIAHLVRAGEQLSPLIDGFVGASDQPQDIAERPTDRHEGDSVFACIDGCNGLTGQRLRLCLRTLTCA